MKKVMLLHGVNHNMFGKRDPKQYGTITLDGINKKVDDLAKELDIEVTNFPQFKENLMTKIDIDEINEISNKEFKRRYNNKAFSWRGRKLIKRNLDIIYEENKINL